jgi:hypothetical protein
MYSIVVASCMFCTVFTLSFMCGFGPWLWKEVKNKEEKGKCTLHGRHINSCWGEVSKRVENMERSMEKKVVG